MRSQNAIETSVWELGQRQHGVVARQQLLELGMSTARVSRWIQAARLVHVHRGVYALGHWPTTELARWRAATLARGDLAVAVDESAGGVWDLGVSDGGLSRVAVPGDSGRSLRPGQHVSRRPDLPACDRTVHLGIPVTTLARTIVDLSALLTPGALRRVLERAGRLEQFDRRLVEIVIARRRGMPGVGRLAGLLEDASRHGLPTTRSRLEADFIEFCRAHQLPRPQVNRMEHGMEVDFRWPRAKVIVETDGWEFHRTREAFERDALRTQKLSTEGWIVVRVTWRQLQRDATGVAARLRQALNHKPANGG